MRSPTARLALGAAGLAAAGAAWAQGGQRPVPQPNPSGTALTVTTQRTIDPRNAFFQNLGTNGRTCNSCHFEQDGWSLTPERARSLFDASGGTHPLFRTNDGSNAPGLDVSTVAARRDAFSLLLNRAVIRVGLPIPAGAEFQLVGVDDPYGFASAAELSLFRRPLASANLKFHPVIMWDGRESRPGLTGDQVLANQAAGATTGHAQAAARPADMTLARIVTFESALFHAQNRDTVAGALNSLGARGGPSNLSRQRLTPGGFTLFRSFARPSRTTPPAVAARRQQIALGENLFNTRQFFVRDVRGLNDEQGQPVINATCTTCHNTANVGTNTHALFMDIGVSDGARRTPDQPLYTLENTATRQQIETTDPGRALITGRWADVNRFKIPSMRGLSARHPFFHDGSAGSVRAVVDFYDTRFTMRLSEPEKQAMTAFLEAL